MIEATVTLPLSEFDEMRRRLEKSEDPNEEATPTFRTLTDADMPFGLSVAGEPNRQS